VCDVRDILLAGDMDEQEVARLLVPYALKDPSAADAALQRMCPQPADRLALAENLPVILESAARTGNPEQCLLQLERLAENHGQPSFLYRRLGGDPRTLDVFFSVVSASRALADLLALNPEYLEILADWDGLGHGRDLSDLRLEASGLTAVFSESAARLNALRRMRRREYLRIGARDLTGLGTFNEVVAEISDLACAMVAETLAVCHESVAWNGAERPDRLAVVAFGKLGARELNYSSDIDLALVWAPGADPKEGVFYQRLCQALVDAVGQLSPEGRMYRVDLRLRPFGKSGPIGCPLEQFLNYYESWSEPWERQALIKARTIAGPRDMRERIDRFIHEFAFARPMDTVSIRSILAVKERSENYRARDGHMDRQVKHGWGGIRDVEFTVQLLQLVAGCQRPEVRAPATLDALAALADVGVISRREEVALSSAYVFLRQVEHRLQLVDELPIQEIPEDPDKLRPLAVGMGYRDEPEQSAEECFLADYQQTTQTVRSIHERLFREYQEALPDVHAEDERVVLEESTDPAPLARYGFRDVAEAARRLRLIVRGPEMGSVSSEPQRRFLQLLPELLDALSRSPDADLSLAQLQRMADASGAPLAFFRAVASNPVSLDMFVRLAAASDFLVEALSRHPEYLDTLSHAQALRGCRTLGDLQQDLAARVRSADGLEDRLNALRRFRLKEFLRIGVRDVAGVAPVTATTREISLLAEACIRVAFDMATGKLDGVRPLPGALAVLGMGKLGGRELHYSSDVDLVCAYQDKPGSDGFTAFEKAVRGMLDALGRLTGEGRGFRVDLRLRPEGKGGLLALPIEGYARYLRENVQAWERQALVRARYVAGSRPLASRLLALAEDAVWGRALTAEDLQQLRHVKRRIETEKSRNSSEMIDLKLGPGGILDVEFTVQMLQLAWGAELPRLRQPNTVRAIAELGKAGVLPAGEAKALRQAYLFLRRAESRLQIMKESAEDGMPRDPESVAVFARRLGYAQNEGGRPPGEAFLADLNRHTAIARTIHQRVYFEEDLTRDAWGSPRRSG